MKKLWIICATVLLIGLSSCGNLAQVPPEDAVQIAVMQQLVKAQNTISQDLGLPVSATPNFKIDRLTIRRREKLNDSMFGAEGYPSEIYKVSGTVETTLNALDSKTQHTSPFEVILGTTPPALEAAAPEVESWYLIPPDKT